jgi:hypothetical protein
MGYQRKADSIVRRNPTRIFLQTSIKSSIRAIILENSSMICGDGIAHDHIWKNEATIRTQIAHFTKNLSLYPAALPSHFVPDFDEEAGCHATSRPTSGQKYVNLEIIGQRLKGCLFRVCFKLLLAPAVPNRREFTKTSLPWERRHLRK